MPVSNHTDTRGERRQKKQEKKRKMGVSGKQVFTLQKLITSGGKGRKGAVPINGGHVYGGFSAVSRAVQDVVQTLIVP